MTKPLEQANLLIEQIKKEAYKALSMPFPDFESFNNYLDNLSPSEQREFNDLRRRALTRNDVSSLEEISTLAILVRRVDELKDAVQNYDKNINLDNICFGTVPGGGFNAYAKKVENANEYVVVLPEGMLPMLNLWAKIINLLLPMRSVTGGVMFLPNARYMQHQLTKHPYIQIRIQNLLESYFIYGDPYSAARYYGQLPFQEFSFLLSGTELYLVAHEAAHIILNHFDSETNLSKEIEYRADELAYKIVANHFMKVKAPFPEASANLCAILFHSLNSLWDTAISAAESVSAGNGIPTSFGIDWEKPNTFIAFTSHPTAFERFQNHNNLIAANPNIPIPNWYEYVYNACKYATSVMSMIPLRDICQSGLSGLNFRVLPSQHVQEGNWYSHEEIINIRLTANLLLSGDKRKRTLGLWFLNKDMPYSALRLYKGLQNEDEDIATLTGKILISIDSSYETYLPRLVQRFREEKEKGAFQHYLLKISTYLEFVIKEELGNKADLDPMNMDFYV